MVSIKRLACLRLTTEHTGLIKKLSCSVCPASEQCVPLSLLVGFLQQTDNRAPAGLPVHLTGHDSSHAGLFHTLSVPCLIYFWFFFSTHPTLCLPPSLSIRQSYVLTRRFHTRFLFCWHIAKVYCVFLATTFSVSCLPSFRRMHFNKPSGNAYEHAFSEVGHMDS